MQRARLALATALFAVAFGTNVSTPLLLVYEDELGLSTWTITALFAIYPIGLAPALAYAGPASDVLGRRAVLLPGLALSGLASVVMIAGRDTLWLLFVGRLLLGVVSGMVFVVASAWMQELGDHDPLWTARMVSLVLYGGFGLGPLVSGILGQWAPYPLVLPYLVHVALVAIALPLLGIVPETIAKRAAAIRPNLGIPDGARSEFWRVVVPTALGVFGFPALTFGLFPVLLRPEMPGAAVLVTGVVFVIAMGLIIPVQAVVGRIGPYRAAPLGLAFATIGTALGLIAFGTGWWGIVFLAAMAMGIASGMCMTSGLRFVELITDPRSRGALTGSFYAAAYAGMTSPIIASTMARAIGYEWTLALFTAFAATLAWWLERATRGARRSVRAPLG